MNSTPDGRRKGVHQDGDDEGAIAPRSSFEKLGRERESFAEGRGGDRGGCIHVIPITSPPPRSGVRVVEFLDSFARVRRRRISDSEILNQHGFELVSSSLIHRTQV